MKIGVQEQLALLKLGDPKVLESIYKENESKFIHWAQRNHHVSEEEAKDLFQNCVIICYENVVSGKLTELNCTIGTYLFSIGNNLIKAFLRKKAKQPLSIEEIRELDVPEEVYAITVNPGKIVSVLDGLGQRCKELLLAATSTAFKSEEMAEKLGYPSAEMYRKKKHECLKKLKGDIQEKKMVIEDFLE
jgi:RNA polymerase sigma factor (sigma-70 family)